MADDLNRPLGLPGNLGRKRRVPVIALVAPPLALLLAVGLVWLGRTGDVPAEEPPAVARIDGAGAAPLPTAGEVPTPAARPGATGTTTTAAVAAPGTSGLTEIEAPDEGGLTELKPGDVVIHDAAARPGIRLAAAPRDDLVEKSSFGPLPKVGADGSRPLDAYARPADVAKGMKRIAIVIGGIGIAEAGTEASIEQLPGEVTLAFAPYGKDLAKAVDAARKGGHEILLQVPLEPYNYPDVDPGPKTLTTEASAAQNLDRLHWLMGRLTTYVGVVNYMGARFTGDSAALDPFLAEIGARGLLYLDDGSSARSKAAESARDKVPFVRADVVLDADTDPAAIDARLKQLAAIARERGYAVATGTAFPATVERVAAFVKAAADRGIAIVPVSALVAAGPT
jgi:polysaccharide deacetylase 2 family uncharacterized protein YibQ